MRAGADNLITVPLDDKHLETCFIGAVEQWVELGEFVGWDIKKGYPEILTDRKSGKPVRSSLPLSSSRTTLLLKQSAVEAGLRSELSMYSFRSGGAGVRELLQETICPLSCNARFGKTPKLLGGTCS